MHSLFFFFLNDTATTEIYTLSLHDALPICRDEGRRRARQARERAREEAGALRARLEDQALARVGPPSVADAGAGEVDDAADALEAVGVDRAGLGIPAELVVTGRLAPNDANRPMTLAGERGQERRPDETVRPGDRDIHADSMDVSSAPSST